MQAVPWTPVPEQVLLCSKQNTAIWAKFSAHILQKTLYRSGKSPPTALSNTPLQSYAEIRLYKDIEMTSIPKTILVGSVSTPYYTFYFEGIVTGISLMIKSTSNNPASIAEVQVFASKPPSPFFASILSPVHHSQALFAPLLTSCQLLPYADQQTRARVAQRAPHLETPSHLVPAHQDTDT